MGSEHTDFAALDAAIAESRADEDYGRILSLVAANLSDAAGAPHLIRYAAEALAELERQEDAVELYTDLAHYALDIDRPLDALVAIDALTGLQPDAGEALIGLLLDRYAAGSARLERGHTPVALPSDGAIMVEPIGEADVPPEVRIENALLACGAVLESDREPLAASPVPLLSDLGGDDLARLLLRLEIEVREEGDILIAEGQPVGGLWWLARGGMTVHSRELGSRALNGPNILLGLESLFGEPSRVTITCLGRCDLVFLGQDALSQLMNEGPVLRREVQQLVARYELHQALSRCPLFRQLPLEKHAHLLAKFEAYRIPDGQLLVRQSAPSPGLFLLIQGGVELRVENGDADRVVAQLEPGELIGLIGLEAGELSRLSAIANEGSRVLFLDRDDLAEALIQHPEAEVVLKRLREDRAALVSMALAD